MSIAVVDSRLLKPVLKMPFTNREKSEIDVTCDTHMLEEKRLHDCVWKNLQESGYLEVLRSDGTML
jgi:hypothetical protein